ncbi:MAG: LysM peptidoglycan-binding domain-containing protein [Anaerolineae bacterium]|nr:LysM peptidoglycan-binding domain-containing protein [Anaerolineae bacterium]
MHPKGLLVGVMGVMVLIAIIVVVSGSASPFDDPLQTPTESSVTIVSTPSMPAPVEGTGVVPTSTPVQISIPQTIPMMHTVERGQNLYRISLIYGVTTESIIAANNLMNPDAIYEGQILSIPADGLPIVTTVDAASFAINVRPEMLVSNNLTNFPVPIEPSDLQGIPIDSLVVMPPMVVNRVQAIYALGQALRRNPHAFSKLGDSTIENPHFLARFDEPGQYNLGNYAYLQGVVDYFHGSFGRQGVAVRRGLHSWSVNDPMWADQSFCRGGETVVACEIRLHNPSFIFIRLGSNDVGVSDVFDRNMREIVEFCINSGVVPMIGTKADRHEGSNRNNEIMRQIAADYRVPLWDFDAVSATIPGRGLDMDGTHLTTFFAHDWRSSLAFQRGHGVHSLLALMTLQRVLEVVTG